MKTAFMLIVGGICSALAGAILLTTCTYALDLTLRPKVGGSDFYAVVFFVVMVPGGILWGALYGIVWAFTSLKKRRSAGCVSIISSFITTYAFIAYFSLSMRHKWQNPDWKRMIDYLRTDSFVFSLLLLWSLYFLIRGITLLGKFTNNASNES